MKALLKKLFPSPPPLPPRSYAGTREAVDRLLGPTHPELRWRLHRALDDMNARAAIEARGQSLISMGQRLFNVVPYDRERADCRTDGQLNELRLKVEQITALFSHEYQVQILLNQIREGL